MFDLLIKNGFVIDGSGQNRTKSDIGITGEKISFIGDSKGKESKESINVDGMIVSPGFIDTHTHHDGVLLLDPQHASSLRQGVTTEILGQDGLSYAPLSSENYKIQRKYLSGILGMPPENIDMSSISAFRSNYHKKVSINTAYPVSHGALRIESVGFHDKPLKGKKLDHAKSLLMEGLEQGSVGLATGMSYHPNAWSTTEELIELCKVVKEKDGVYITHLRDVNTDRGFGGGGVPEAIHIGKKSGVRVHFSHTRTSAENAGQVSEVLKLIDKAKEEGVDCTLELYPYPTGSSFLLSNLPSWAHEGGPKEILERLNNKDSRLKIIKSFGLNKKRSMDQILLSYLPNNPELEGMTVLELSEIRGVSMGDLICDLLVEQDLQVGFWQIPPDSISKWRQISKDAMEFISRSDYMIGSDSIRLGSVPHPRAYGTFPRFIGRLRRQFNLISLEQMIQRITNNPAKTFNLKNRGLLKEGYFADLVVFDEEKIIDTATYDDAKQFPVGIPYVIVNGKIAVRKEICTGILAGQAIP
jgi:N-acyl-D-amino-acid deacylase